MNTRLVKFIIFINLVLLVGQFLMTSSRATDGARLADLTSQLSSLNQANLDLKNQIYHYSSIPYIYSQAQSDQLAPAQVSYLTPLPVASAARP